MALYAIGDLHLSLGSDKPMEIFRDVSSRPISRSRTFSLWVPWLSSS